MARPRNPNREKAKIQWLESGGTLSAKELAAVYDVPDHRIRKWKSEDKWQAVLDAPEPKKQGGQKGNQNAKGHGAPINNKNAETHGAYSRVHLDGLPPEERAYIESLTLDTEDMMLRELQLLSAKERDLTRKIKAYEKAESDTLYVDRVVEMFVPRDNEDGDKSADAGDFKTSVKTVVKSSSFDRLMKLEAEYNKLHGRILKLVDSVRAQRYDVKRFDIDERKHTLAKQRLSGAYSIDPDTGEIDDTTNPEDVED